MPCAIRTAAFTDLGTLGGNLSQAFGINDTGHIVGYANLSPTGAVKRGRRLEFGRLHAFLWKDGVMKDLGTLGGNKSTAFAVNASGHVVGVAETSDNRKHPFLWHLDAMTNLAAPMGCTPGRSTSMRQTRLWGLRRFGTG
jgi:probable HAF family extracellular repeat protein